MQEGWNKNMKEHFGPSWVSVLDESIHDWINLCTCTGWMFVPCKPQTFGNKYLTIACAKSKVIYNFDIVEGKDWTRVMGRKSLKRRG